MTSRRPATWSSPTTLVRPRGCGGRPRPMRRSGRRRPFSTRTRWAPKSARTGSSPAWPSSTAEPCTRPSWRPVWRGPPPTPARRCTPARRWSASNAPRRGTHGAHHRRRHRGRRGHRRHQRHHRFVARAVARPADPRRRQLHHRHRADRRRRRPPPSARGDGCSSTPRTSCTTGGCPPTAPASCSGAGPRSRPPRSTPPATSSTRRWCTSTPRSPGCAWRGPGAARSALTVDRMPHIGRHDAERASCTPWATAAPASPPRCTSGARWVAGCAATASCRVRGRPLAAASRCPDACPGSPARGRVVVPGARRAGTLSEARPRSASGGPLRQRGAELAVDLDVAVDLRVLVLDRERPLLLVARAS